MDNLDAFTDNLTELNKLFPKFTSKEIRDIKKLHKSSEKYWNRNLQRFKNQIIN
jgi:hypothetical protein